MSRMNRLYYLFRMLFSAKSFPIWQTLGFHLTPTHYYQPIPDTRSLKPEVWKRQSDLVGIQLNEDRQTELLSEFNTRFASECQRLPRAKTAVRHQYYLANPHFNFADGYIWYCMIRHFKPRRIVEVGSGCSTYLAAQAVLANRDLDGQECELTAIDPYPSRVHRDGFPGLSRVIAQQVQDIPLDMFTELRTNDILFVDSSHVLRIGSDVQYLVLEVVPSA